MKKSFFIACVLLVVFLGVLFVARFCARETGGFELVRIASCSAEVKSSLLSPKEKEELGIVLSQPFSYLGAGGQAFAFVSKDGKYVLKFFNHRFPYPGLVRKIFDKRMAYAREKLNRDFASYRLAFSELKEESALLFLHLDRTDDLHKKVALIDKLGISHEVDLDAVEFLVQKKGTLLTTYLEEANEEEAKAALTSVVKIFISRCKKGIFDEDPRLHKNVGLLGKDPLFIDAGRFKKDERRKEKEVYKQDLQAATSRLKKWLAERHPTLAAHLEKEIENVD